MSIMKWNLIVLLKIIKFCICYFFATWCGPCEFCFFVSGIRFIWWRSIVPHLDNSFLFGFIFKKFKFQFKILQKLRLIFANFKFELKFFKNQSQKIKFYV